jgi:hypothetical protein
MECDKCCVCACTCMKENWDKKRIRRSDDWYPPEKIRKQSELPHDPEYDESQSTEFEGDTIKSIFRAFQMDEHSSLIRHLPSLKRRSDIVTWTEDSQEAKIARKRVINLYREILRLVSVALCGENAAERSVEKAVEVISGQLHNTSANCHAGNVLPKIMSTGLSKNSI